MKNVCLCVCFESHLLGCSVYCIVYTEDVDDDDDDDANDEETVSQSVNFRCKNINIYYSISCGVCAHGAHNTHIPVVIVANPNK